MKRKITFLLSLIFILICFTGCFARESVKLPTEDYLREIIPAEADIDPEPYLELLQTPFSLNVVLADIPLIFELDESKWTEDFSSGDTDYYKPIEESESGRDEYISLSEDYAFVITTDTELYYNLNEQGQMALTSAEFLGTDTRVYLGSDFWSISFPYKDVKADLNYSYEDILEYAYFAADSRNGYEIYYNANSDSTEISYYRMIPDSEEVSHDFSAHYDDNKALSGISYYRDIDQSFFSDGYIYAYYDNNYQLTDTNAPGGIEAHQQGTIETTEDTANLEELPEEPVTPPSSTKEDPLPPQQSEAPANNELWESFKNNDPEFWSQLKDLF